jgi:hypothetical protein
VHALEKPAQALEKSLPPYVWLLYCGLSFVFLWICV